MSKDKEESLVIATTRRKLLSLSNISSKMNQLLKSNIGKLRILTFLEGVSLLILMFVCMPLKYFYDMPIYNKIMGYLHGGLFIVFIYYVWIVAKEYQWKHTETTWKVILSSFFPFGSFYIDHTILKKIDNSNSH